MDYPIQVSDQLQEHLKSLRKLRGLTQRQLAAMLGVGQSRIAEIEGAPGQVALEQIVRILAALGATLSLQIPGTADAVGEPLRETMSRSKAALPHLPDRKWELAPLKGSGGRPASYLVKPPVPDRSVATLERLRTLNPGFDVQPTSRGHFVLRETSGEW